MKRKNTGCLLLMLLLAVLAGWRLWSVFDVPESGTYGEADRIIAAFAEENDLRLSDYP